MKALALCLSSLFSLYLLFYGYFTEDSAAFLLGTATPSYDDVVFSDCLLAESPPWTPEMRKLLSPSYDPLKNCRRDWKPYTRLDDDGIVRVTLSNASLSCRARAVLHNGDYKIKLGAWHRTEEDFVFENDIVEAECMQSNKTIYSWIHYQVWNGTPALKLEKGTTTATPEDISTSEDAAEEQQWDSPPPIKPNVYVILFDSLAATQAQRVFPRTVKFLESQFDSISFRHMNKVGENSRPNGAALFLGKLLSPLNRQIFGMESEQPDWNYNQICKRFLDNDSFILSEFGKAGYRTLMAEDWDLGVFNWPNCNGFKKQPTTHYMRPFQVRLLKQSASPARSLMSAKNCLEHHMFLLEYLEKFIHAYPDSPKFGLAWASYLAHDVANLPFHADKWLLDFFTRNRKEFDNSFLFFMGDHGLRFGKVRYSNLGKVEVNNPMLWISVPRWMRENRQLMGNMRRNGVQLLTMFDTHASFVDILKHAPLTSFSDWSALGNLTKRGSSLFRQLPSGPRNCKTLPIPIQYCLCEIKRIPVKDKSKMAGAGEAVAEGVNAILAETLMTDKCAALQAHKVKSLSFIERSDHLYEVVVAMQPGNGEFQTYIREVEEGKFVPAVPSFTRLNSYGRTADCIDRNELRPYCFCLQQSKNSSSTKSPK